MSKPPTEEWSDQDVYYWVFEINIGEKHAVALWDAAIDGQALLSLKKSQLQDHCKTLNQEITQNLWQEIKKLQKHGRSIFRKPKPSPSAPDYPSDEDFSDFSDEGVDDEPTDPNAASLPDRLKARLKEFKQQQEQQQQEQHQGGDTMDEYIVPDDNSVEEHQDEYEEFDVDPDGQAGQDELYLTPPNESNHDEDIPPPVPFRVPLSHGGDSHSNGAPILPPRPGEKQKPIPMFQPPAPIAGDDSEEEYVVPASQGDPTHPQAQTDNDCDELYEPPKETPDFGDDYISPDQVPRRPDGRRSPLPSIPGIPKPKPPLPGNSAGKAPDMSRRAPAALPPTTSKFTSSNSPSMFNASNTTSKFIGSTGTNASKFPGSTSTSTSKFPNAGTNKFTTSSVNNHSKLGNKPGFSSFRESKDRFEKQPAPAPKPFSKNKMGGSLHQIKQELDSIKPRPKSNIPYRPASPKPTPPEPIRPEIPKPRQPQNTDKNDMSNCNWFRSDVDRETVASALLNHRVDGAFVVRPSKRNPEYPYTLQLLYKGKIKNLPIGKRPDRKFALGAPKDGETKFESVKELVEYHRRNEVVLANNEGKTCLLEAVPLP